MRALRTDARQLLDENVALLRLLNLEFGENLGLLLDRDKNPNGCVSPDGLQLRLDRGRAPADGKAWPNVPADHAVFPGLSARAQSLDHLLLRSLGPRSRTARVACS